MKNSGKSYNTFKDENSVDVDPKAQNDLEFPSKTGSMDFGHPSKAGSKESLESTDEVTFEKLLSSTVRLLRVVLPAIASQMVCLLSETTCMYFVGNANNSRLTAGVGLAIVYVNCTCQSVLTGLNNAITVLVSISFGQNDMKQCEKVL